MALKGNLRDFSVTQLLNLINLAKKNGTLVIDGINEQARVAFRDGRLSYAQLGTEDNSLAAILLRSKKISHNQYRTLRERATHMTDKELGLLLINAGYMSQEDILGSLQQYFIGIVQKLFTWVEGLFHFEPDLPPPDDKIPVRLELENIIIEGSRQMREWEQMHDEIPSLEISLKFTDRPGANIKNLNLSVEEWKVVHYINPKNTISQIARATKMNDLEIRKVVYALMQAGVVEFLRPAGMPINLSKGVFAIGGREEQKSLVNRLIDRIKAI
jgi:Domain of unknown function (DUF4388)